jgi:hypothetical protein
MLNDAGVAILGGAEDISTETEDKFTHRLISSIGVLQIMETHSNGNQLLNQVLRPMDCQSIRISGE